MPSVALAPPRPLLVFDGDCGFCRFWIARWKNATGDRVDYAPYQEAARRFPEIAVEDFRRAVQLVMPGGEVYSGAEAALRALAEAPGRRRWLEIYRRVPGARLVIDAAYRFIARHRRAAFAVSRFFRGSGG